MTSSTVELGSALAMYEIRPVAMIAWNLEFCSLETKFADHLVECNIYGTVYTNEGNPDSHKSYDEFHPSK